MSQDRNNLDPAPDPSDVREQVVAYLDGELDDESVSRLEAQLASDAALRRQLVEMEQAWEALDQLGRSEVDETFTQTTMEMVAVAAEEDLNTRDEDVPRKRRRRWLLGTGTVAASIAAGFLLVVATRENPNQQLLDDLPVLEKIDQYRQIDDVDFLLKLYEADRQQEGGLFPENEDDQ